MGTNLDTRWAATKGVKPFPDAMSLVQPLVPLFADAQLALLNIEGAIGAGAAPQKCSRRSNTCFAIRQPLGTETALRAVGPQAQMVGNVANNHSRDAGEPGFAETRRRLAAAGILVTGADTIPTPVPVGEGDTVAVLGYSAWNRPTVHDLDALRRHVAAAQLRYGRVIVTMHIGAEGPSARHTPDREERFVGERRGNSVAFARAASEAGASMVIGHGPHVLRGIEWVGKALVTHSLGNLLTYGPFTLTGPNGRAAVVCATLEADGSVSNAVARSTKQVPPGIVSADSTNGALNDLRELSLSDFVKTGALIGADGAITRRP
jgi:hypothetical protein